MPSKPRAESRPFVDTYLSYLLAHASQAVSGEFHAVLQDWGVSVAEWRLLSSLHGRESLGVSDLAAMAILKMPRVTAIVDRLAAAGLVERVRTKGDRRRVGVRLTSKGRDHVSPMLRAAKSHEARILAALTPNEQKIISHALDLIMRRASIRAVAGRDSRAKPRRNASDQARAIDNVRGSRLYFR